MQAVARRMVASRGRWLQGVEDLEEVLSERLQQLPAPSSERRSAEVVREAPLVHMPDELPAERARVRADPGGMPCTTSRPVTVDAGAEREVVMWCSTAWWTCSTGRRG